MGLEDFFGPPGQAPARKIEEDVPSVGDSLDAYLRVRPEDSHHKDDSFWHCSSVSHDLCPRYETILRTVDPKFRPVGNVGPDSLRIFDIGSAVHHWWQNKYFGPMRVLFGRWSCVGCGRDYPGFWLPTHPTCSCQTPVEYVELTLSMPLVGKPVSGHCDGIWVDEKTGRWFLLELKTINPFGFSKLSVPDPNYVDQIILYLHALRRYTNLICNGVGDLEPFYDELRNIDTGRLVYIDKSSGKCKEFLIPYSEERAVTLLSRLAETNAALAAGAAGNFLTTLPGRHGHCTDVAATKSKGCFFRQACWQCSTLKEVMEFYTSDNPAVAAVDPWDVPGQTK